jgi:hypothetical protein
MTIGFESEIAPRNRGSPAEARAASIGENGTIRAGEFLTNARFLEQISKRA